MDEMTVQMVSLVLMLVPLPLVAYGVLEDIAFLWWGGIVLIVIGGLIPPATRYLFEDEDEDSQAE